MTFIPQALLRNLYNRSSLRNTGAGVRFSVKNRLSPATLERIERIELNEEAIPAEKIRVAVDSGDAFPMSHIGPDTPVEFPLGTLLTFHLEVDELDEGKHGLELAFETRPFGRLKFGVKDALRTGARSPGAVPRDPEDDYSQEVIRARQEFVRQRTGVVLEHINRFSFEPAVTQGNIEHFTGVAQIPLGIAGPLLVHGAHAKGEFYVPLATSEGTLVASYNRGMKVIHECGGAKCAVVGDNMQRAPVFIFEDAAAARRFADFLAERSDDLKRVCSDSDPFVTLKYVDYYLSNKFCFTRFNYTTGDAAGMNMVGKATFAACNWILENFKEEEIEDFYLESNFATDKKASMINAMRTRGKRVTAEVVVRRDVLRDVMDADTESIHKHWQVASIGSMLSGANNNGCHAANAITAIFIATGQDVANVSESSVGLVYTDLTPEKDLYMSITLPSLIVATCGGGTGLPTQQESLKIMQCAGPGKVMQFAEIVAGTVLAGEISLAAAISSLDWVSSHEQLGRNDPTKG